MSDVCSRLILKYWRLGAELLFFLVAGWALLAQIGCQVQGYASRGVVQLKDVELRPAFAVDGESPPATIRYWIGPDHQIKVRWGQILVGGPTCSICPGQACAEPMPPRFPVDPDVVATFREQSGADAEDARFPYTDSCSASAWASFTPRPPDAGREEERNYLASIQFGDGSPIPGESPASVVVRIIPKSITMPPRRLVQLSGEQRTWRWPTEFRGRAVSLYEAFDPKLQVAKVRIVQGNCRVPPPAMSSDLEQERLNLECGDDKFLNSDIDETTLVVPYRIIVTNQENSEDYQRCESVDGEIDFGREGNSSPLSRCREDSRPREFVRMTPTLLVEPPRRRLVWKVEFDADKGFPPPQSGLDLWIIFTLEPLP